MTNFFHSWNLSFELESRETTSLDRIRKKIQKIGNFNYPGDTVLTTKVQLYRLRACEFKIFSLKLNENLQAVQERPMAVKEKNSFDISALFKTPRRRVKKCANFKTCNFVSLPRIVLTLHCHVCSLILPIPIIILSSSNGRILALLWRLSKKNYNASCDWFHSLLQRHRNNHRRCTMKISNKLQQKALSDHSELWDEIHCCMLETKEGKISLGYVCLWRHFCLNWTQSHGTSDNPYPYSKHKTLKNAEGQNRANLVA